MKNGFLKNDRRILAIVAIVFAVYAALFIYRSSFDVFGERYFSLFDDAMISMTYAKNLANGHGLVWNPGGERVEGFTNPLWVAFMAALHKLPVPPSKLCILVQIFGALFLVANLFFVRKIALHVSRGNGVAASAAVILTAAYYPLIFWSLMGMEVSLLTLLVSVYAAAALGCLKSGRFPWRLYVLMGAGTLVRLDMAVPLLAIGAYLALSKPKDRKKHILWSVLTLAVFLGGQTIARVLYYGDVFPNTYYLKMTGYPAYLRILRGLVVFFRFAGRSNILLFLLPFAALAFSGGKHGRFIAWVFCAQAAYSIYVGGESWESWGGANRFVSIVMPLFFVLFAYALTVMAEWTDGIIRERKNAQAAWWRLPYRAALPAALLVTVLSFNGHALGEFLLLKPPNQTDINRESVQRAMMIREFTKPEATTALTLAGTIPYFAERRGIDVLGKCDSRIARQEARIPKSLASINLFTPGHVKWDMDYTFGGEKPDVVTHVWGGGREEVAPYLDRFYYFLGIASGDDSETAYQFWFRAGSDAILWDMIPGAPPVSP